MKHSKFFISTLLIVAVFATVLCLDTALASGTNVNITVNISSATNPYPLPEGKYTFNVDETRQNVKLPKGNTTGTSTFQVALKSSQANPEKVQLLGFPDANGTMAIASQSYDKDKKILNIQISRNIILFAQHLNPNISFSTLGTGSGRLNGIVFGLYDTNNSLLQKSTVISYYGLSNEMFSAVLPGQYTIKIESAPKNITENYDLSRTFKLVVADNGKTTMDGNGPLGVPSNNGAYLDGIKTPFQIWLSKLPTIEKKVSNDTSAENVFAKAVNASPGDVLEFQIERSIHADHNFELGFANAIKFTSKLNIEFTDKLPQGLSYIDNTLQIMENGNPSADFVGNYDKATRTITVTHNSTVNKITIPFDGNISIPADRKITILFNCTVDDDFNKEIINTAVGNGRKSSAKVIPEIKNTPTPSKSTPTPSKPSVTPVISTPKTGDTTNIEHYIAFVLLSLLVLFAVIGKKLKSIH